MCELLCVGLGVVVENCVELFEDCVFVGIFVIVVVMVCVDDVVCVIGCGVDVDVGVDLCV